MNNVIYVGPFCFPDGGAAARRILGISKSIQAAGFDVKVASGQNPKTGEISQWVDGIEVFSIGERTAENWPTLLKHMAYITMGRSTVAWLNSLSDKPKAVILYSGYSPYLLNLLPWAKKNKVKLIFDAVEWYEPNSFFGRFSPYQINIEFAMRCLLPRVGNIISISGYLHKYYASKGCQSIVVPPTLDTSLIIPRYEGRGNQCALKLVYAGTPGKKDLLGRIIEAVLHLRRSNYNLHLSVAGVEASDAKQYANIEIFSGDEVSAGVNFMGVLNHDASIDLVRQADFSLLLRPDARYSRAGFPTKFVESFSVGTPVIGNITSDLHRYLKSNETGIVCRGPTSEYMIDALLHALKVDDVQHAAMRFRCRKIAEEFFDAKAYISPLVQLLN